MSELLITGASGHLGSALLKKSIAAGKYRVTALVRSAASAERLRALTSPADVRVLAADLGSSELPSILRDTRFAAVVHCAAHIPSVADEDNARAALYAANVRGTAQLLATLGDRTDHLIFVSSLAVYDPSAATVPIGEQARCTPATFYGASKLIGEQLARMHCDTTGTKLTILRTHSLYGPGETQARALPTFFRLALEGSPIFLAAMGHAKRNYVFVNDAADAVLTCLDHGAQGTANVAGRRVFTLAELAREVVHACGGESPIFQLPGAHRDLVLDTTHAAALGIRCETELARGIAAQHAWLAAQRRNAHDFYHYL